MENSSDALISEVSSDIVAENDDSPVGEVLDGNSSDDNSSDDVIEENKTASFKPVSQSNYLIGDSFFVNLVDENGTGIANKTIFFLLNGKIIGNGLTNESGVANYTLKMAKGFYTIRYVFNETGYLPAAATKKILLLSKHTSTIKGSNMKAYAGVKKVFKVTLKADGILLPNRKVTFTVNKKTYTKKTDSKGVATLTIYLSKGTYTIKYSYAGEYNIKTVKSSAKLTIKLLKNPYKTKYRTVIIDADGGFTKAFLNDVAGKLRKAGWKVIVKGIGPNQHSINYKKVKNCVYMPFYNGLCAATIQEMTYSYYGGLIKSNHGVLTPAWYTNNWTSKKMSQYRNDITKIKFLKRAWDDNFSPASYKGLSYPAKFMTKNKIKYCVGDTSYKIVEQFLFGGWVAHH